MGISHSQVTNAISNEVIRPYWISYFREFVRGRVHDQLLEAFEEWKRRGSNRAGMAKKLGRRPEQITRWLGAPSNLEIDTISDIALAMGCVPIITLEPIEGLARSHNGTVEIELPSGGSESGHSTGFVFGPSTGSSARALEVTPAQ